jgi:pSer/pThr/pTyr-binding forkhead associated (FHA) protein/S1-C subfamily serine protease
MRGRLVFTSGSRAGTDFELTGIEVTIGRSPDCTLQLSPSEVVVSGHHATVYEIGGRYYLRDENSRNGTFIDGRQVKECEIRPGQTIMFGPNGPTAQLEVVAEDVVATTPMPGAWGSPATAYVPPKVAKAPATPPAGAGSSSGSGLTGLYYMARDQAAAGAASGRPSQTAVMKAFVKLAQERASRRLRVALIAVAVIGAVAVALVFVLGERKAEALRGQLTAMSSELRSQGEARTALEQKLSQLASTTSQWQNQAESLSQNLQQNREEIDRQRRELAQQKQSVEEDRRFGPAVTQRYAAGVGLIEFRIGWFNDQAGWLRIKGTPDGKVGLSTDQADHLALLGTSQCTGFLINAVGWVLTNRHCVDFGFANADLIEQATLNLGKNGELVFKPAIAGWRIGFPPGKVYEVDPKTIQASREHDLGLFRTTRSPEGVPVLPLARGQPVVAGEDVVLLAYPGGTEVTAARRGVGSFVDPSLSDQVQGSVRRAVDAFAREAGLAGVLQGLPSDEKQLQALVQSDLGVFLLLQTLSSVAGAAEFDALAHAGQLQPDVSGNMSVSGVTANSISYHTLGGIGGSSGGPLLGTKLAVIGINHAGFATADRGAQYQQNEAVPVDYAWRFLPAGLAQAK